MDSSASCRQALTEDASVASEGAVADAIEDMRRGIEDRNSDG